MGKRLLKNAEEFYWTVSFTGGIHTSLEDKFVLFFWPSWKIRCRLEFSGASQTNIDVYISLCFKFECIGALSDRLWPYVITRTLRSRLDCWTLWWREWRAQGAKQHVWASRNPFPQTKEIRGPSHSIFLIGVLVVISDAGNKDVTRAFQTLILDRLPYFYNGVLITFTLWSIFPWNRTSIFFFFKFEKDHLQLWHMLFYTSAPYTLYTEELFIAIYVLLYIDNSKKY